MHLPKVLIINQPFNTNTGGGITLSNLFAKWDSEKLAVACSGYLLTENMDPTLCNNYYQLGSKERKWIFPFNLFSRKYYSGSIRLTDQSRKNIVVKKSSNRIKLIINCISPIFDFLGLSHFSSKTQISPQFIEWFDNFDPDIIYTQASGLEDMEFCLEVKKHLNKPLVFHMMDDWPSTIASRGLMKNYWKKKIDSKFKKLLDQTDLALSISDYMAEEYKKRYAKEFITFHNPIDVDFWKSAQKTVYNLPNQPTLLYAGRIGLGIDRSLRAIAHVIDNVNKKEGLHIKFSLQTQESPTWIKSYNCVEHRDFVAYEELPRVFANADFLILPYDFDEKAVNFIKYSMPTKASEYMASGTPVLIFAPEDTALVSYAREYGWAAIVSENNYDTLAISIKDLIKNESRRKKISERAKKIAQERHDSQEVALKFQNALLSQVLN